ncbi:DEAD/DEAH box helicase [uncultured Jannaschia sp.]|uniref:DEAD/DEAH box helicase n=1 Tax=uncultured Jannaschia sp. TaxID=293347 RepID=UPI002632359B|nr:DEAD/DEAH box helicase [uncultured Jannaschia sp.]
MTQSRPAGAEALRLAEWMRKTDARRVIHVAASESRAEGIVRFLGATHPSLAIHLLPPWDCLPYDWASPSSAAMGHRLAALREVAGAGDAPALLVTTPAAVIQRVVPRGTRDALALSVGDAMEAEAVVDRLAALAYHEEGRIDEPGEMALRGAVLDVFPAGLDHPLRIAFEDGRIAAIHVFDAASQRTVADRDSAVIDPASELPAEIAREREAGAEHWLPDHHDRLVPLRDEVPGARLSGSPDALSAVGRILSGLPAAREERMQAEVDGGGARRPLPPDRLYLAPADWTSWRKEAAEIALDGVVPAPVIAGEARPRAALRAAIAGAGRTILVAGTARERARLARMAGMDAIAADSWSETEELERGGAATLVAPLDHGHRDGATLVLSGRDVLGRQAAAATGPAAPPPWIAEAQELHLGDLVVHEAHGLGRLEGLEPLNGGEALRIVYGDDDVRLVPASEAGHVWRYGQDEDGVALDRLDGKGWDRRRARFSRAIRESAEAMVEAARGRAELEAPVLKPEAAAYETVAAAFPWEETPDQRAAIGDVLSDLASGRPMNRLLVGDVGFGKTEIAIRAAAAAALAGMQVAVVAPTTVLARQHATTFGRRLAQVGIEVASLSRLTNPAEAKRVRAGLADGTVRVVVGTHAILGKNVSFEALGLVVIDEEQRFGRAHKRALRTMGAAVHTLSMSATPIPGSLEGAIAGVRPLSLLRTAPARRRPIRTIVAPAEPGAIRDALCREARRRGQSFVIVPRIEEIEATEAMLAELVPDLDVRVAHGDRPAREIDETMTGFADGAGDVLLATTIVESGLDVPRANTMIVLRPDLLGLAQLHQLRGRVGRGSRQAYCWLLTDPDVPPNEARERRLDTIAAMDTLGAGLALSVADLDRRGAGDLFGLAQTGHDARVGPALHAAMLADALRRAKGEDKPPRPEIRVDAPWSLPEDYIHSADMRATLYVRLGRIDAPAAAARLADEVEDRFGPPPPEERMALRLARLRALATRLTLRGVSAGPEAVALDFAGQAPDDVPDDVERSGKRLVLRRALEAPEARIEAAIDLLERLS